MAEAGAGWRVVDGTTTAWFDAPSLRTGTELAGRVVDVAPDAAVDVRATGVRVRLGTSADADAVTAAAHDLGLSPDPTVLQQLAVVVTSPDPGAVLPFWRGVLGHDADDGALADPLRRDPTVRFEVATDARPLRNRLHVDVVRPAAAVERVSPGEAGGPYGVRHADADGNEVDLVPGDPLGDSPATADWHAVFGAVAAYRVWSTGQQRDLAAAVAALADDAGFPLLVDLRPGLVVLDTGKDQVEAEAHGLDVDVLGLAARVQAAARDLGATADPDLPRLVQLVVDAADLGAVRAFWAAALGYVPDRRPGLTDLVDPRRLGPVLVLQDLDTSETERVAQRNRLHLELAVPSDVAQERVDAALAAGGRLLGSTDGRWHLTDPERNELVVVGG